MSQNPQAYIAVRNSRLRTEDGVVYLEKDTEFQIELYNPTSGKIGAQITLDGKKQGATLILRPGERIFLDRYLDDKRKYKFDTYLVDGSAETKNAIKNNGGLKVEFFRERTPRPSINLNSYPKHYPWTNPTPNPWYEVNYSSNVRGFNLSDSSYDANLSSSMGYSGQSTSDVVGNVSNHFLRSKVDLGSEFNSMNLASMDFMEQNTTPINSAIETGIVEKGSVSEQDLHYTSVDLEFSAFHTINLKLMPVSQKPAEAALYCVECGRRARKKEKFCPTCGTKHNWDGK